MAKRKLDKKTVYLARTLYNKRLDLLEEANKLTIKALADRFGVSFSTMYDAVMHQTYKEVRPGEPLKTPRWRRTIL